MTSDVNAHHISGGKDIDLDLLLVLLALPRAGNAISFSRSLR